jgi:hypothetical protein
MNNQQGNQAGHLRLSALTPVMLTTGSILAVYPAPLNDAVEMLPVVSMTGFFFPVE